MTDAGSAGFVTAAAAARRFLTFRMGRRLYAIAAEDVSEVIRLPLLARVPLGPKSLLGIANLRGAVLPIASLRGLLGEAEADYGASSRAIVLEGEAAVALAVDAVDALVTIDTAKIETNRAELAALPGERLSGAFQVGGRDEVAKLLDVRALIQAAFVQPARAPRTTTAADSLAGFGEATDDLWDRRKLVSFDVVGQEFALPLEVVREIVTAPEFVTDVPHSEALVLGVMPYRDTLLPLLSLMGLLGLHAQPSDESRRMVVVVVVGGGLVGLVADRMQAIIAADPALIEPTPPMLAARMGGESQVASIYRGDEGARLVSILAPDRLFREDVMATLRQAHEAPAVEAASSATEVRQFLIFQLAGAEFGVPIEVVDEVAPVPAQVTRVPKSPAFLEGVINLRGEVLPVVDQRRRFDMPPAANPGARRLIVVRTERHRAGLIVDSVTEVLRSDADAIDPAPDLAGEVTRLVHGVINLESAGRMVLLLDPAELLTRTERRLLDAFQATAAKDEARQAKA